MPNTPVPSGFGCTCARLRKLARRITRIYDAHLAGSGIKVTQFSLLANVARGELPLGELALSTEMERTTLSRNLTPLARQGWVRIVAGDDPRSRLVSITAAGRKKLATTLPLWRRAQDEMEATLGTDSVAGLHRDIDHALAALPAANLKGELA
jgi:DNA-binding MarR family transcriptional regulator